MGDGGTVAANFSALTMNNDIPGSNSAGDVIACGDGEFLLSPFSVVSLLSAF